MDNRTAPTESRRRGPRVAMLIAAGVVFFAACSQAGTEPADAGGAAASAEGSTAPSPGADAASFDFALFDGSQSSTTAFAGQPAVINFWASWCPSCVAEMSAAFRPVAADFDREVAFIGMNIQDERDRARALLDETGVVWINAEDPDGTLFVELGGLGMPFTVFIDAAGAIVDTHNGPLNEPQLRDAVAELLKS